MALSTAIGIGIPDGGGGSLAPPTSITLRVFSVQESTVSATYNDLVENLTVTVPLILSGGICSGNLVYSVGPPQVSISVNLSCGTISNYPSSPWSGWINPWYETFGFYLDVQVAGSSIRMYAHPDEIRLCDTIRPGVVQSPSYLAGSVGGWTATGFPSFSAEIISLNRA